MRNFLIETVVIDKSSLEELIQNIVRHTMREVLKDVSVTLPIKKEMTVKEASEYYKVPQSTIRKWIHEGKLKGVKIGKYLYVKS